MMFLPIEPKNSYSFPCTNTYQCQDYQGLFCENVSNQCNCPVSSTIGMCDCPRSVSSEFYWDGTKCQNATEYGLSCSNASTSYQCMTMTEGTICSLSGSSYICQCPSLQYFDPTSHTCKNQLSINQSCSGGLCSYVVIVLNNYF